MSRTQKPLLWLAALLFLFITSLILIFPERSLLAAAHAVNIWWDVLFPALFPFLVIAELMLGFGVVHFLGTLLDPLMRPVFRVPVIGGFVMAMGFASGYPVGAKLTSQLWDQKLINRVQGERLVAFTTTSDPIFLIGAVSVGFFHNPGLALILAASHYGAGIMVGLVMRFYGKEEPEQPKASAQKKSLLLAAFQAMHEARLKDGRNMGELLRDAVRTALELVFIIGGLVIFFSVILETLTAVGMLDILYFELNALMSALHLPTQLSQAVVNGLFEVTLGVKAAGAAAVHIPLLYKVMIAAIVISWGGLSVHAQIVSILSRTPFRYTPFLLARLIHSIFAAWLVLILWRPLQPTAAHSDFHPVWSALHLASSIHLLTYSGAVFIASLLILPALYLLYASVKWLMRRIHYS